MQSRLCGISRSPSGRRQKKRASFLSLPTTCKITVALSNLYFSSLFGNNFIVVTNVKACLIVCRVRLRELLQADMPCPVLPPVLNGTAAQHLAKSLGGDRIYINLNFMLFYPIQFLFISKDGQSKVVSFCDCVWGTPHSLSSWFPSKSSNFIQGGSV